MATERTFSIIKPDATRRNLTGKINAVLEDSRSAHHRPEAHPYDAGTGRGASTACMLPGRSSAIW